MSAVTVTLKHPFQFAGRTVSEFTMNRLKGKHMRKLSAKPDVGELIELASQSSGESVVLIDEMDAADLAEVLEVIGDFLGGGLATGKTP